MMLVNRELIPRLEGERSPHWENVYFAKLAASHLYEAGKFLAASEQKVADVAPLLARLPTAAQEGYATVRALGPAGGAVSPSTCIGCETTSFTTPNCFPTLRSTRS
jgi:hypothetical protein